MNTVFEEPHIKGILYGVFYSKQNLLKQNSNSDKTEDIEKLIYRVIDMQNLDINKSDIKIVNIEESCYTIYLDNIKLFSLCSNDEQWYLQTDSFLD